MSDQAGGDVPSEAPQAWDIVRRVREPVALTALALTAIYLLVSACQLFNLAGAKLPFPNPELPGGPGPGPADSAFALRAAVVAPQFTVALVISLPLLSVVLVAFSGGLTEHARQVIQAAAVVQAVALVLGVTSVAGATGNLGLLGTWFILHATELAVVATALIFTSAVLWSRAVRSLVPQSDDLGDSDRDFEDGSDFGEDY